MDAEGNLKYIVFRKDYDSHKANSLELLDTHNVLYMFNCYPVRKYHK